MILVRQSEPVDAEVQELLDRRAVRARSRLEAEVEEAILWVAEFPVGEDRFAVPLSTLRAAVPLRAVTPVPLSPAEIIGVLRFEGEIITGFSLASLLGVRGWREDPAVLLVLDVGGRKVALDCEQIPKPVGLAMTAVDQARANPGPSPWSEVVLADRSQVNLIDVGRLFEKRGAEAGR